MQYSGTFSAFPLVQNFSNSKEHLCLLCNEGGGAGSRLGLGSGGGLDQKPSRAPLSVAELGRKGGAGESGSGGAGRRKRWGRPARGRECGSAAQALPRCFPPAGPPGPAVRSAAAMSKGASEMGWGGVPLCAHPHSSAGRGPGYLKGRGCGFRRAGVSWGAGCRKKKASVLSFCFPGPGFQQEPHRHAGSRGEVPAEPPRGAADPWAQE